jgi:putative ABC transport system permease protein
MPRQTSRTTPLATLNLTHDVRRFATSVAGITFAVILIFVEFGFWNALLDATVLILRNVEADIVVLSKSRYTIAAPAAFNARRLEQAESCAPVAWARPVYIEGFASVLRDALGRGSRKVRVLAFDPDRPVFTIPAVAAALQELKQPDTALIDEETKGFEARQLDAMEPRLMKRALRLIGTFRMGTDFAVEGNLIMSDRNFLKYYPDPRLPSPVLRQVDLGLVRLKEGAELAPALASLRNVLSEDVVVLSKDELIARERRFWQNRSPIGYVFGLGMGMGFVVGVMICYQILSSDISSHLAEYATLKAIGYGRARLVGIVVRESLILALAGFVPGLAISALLYSWLARATGLPMALTVERVALVFIVSVAMCLCSGCLAIRKLFAADPAELFK